MDSGKEKLFNYYLMLTTVLCGGLVMLIELLGSRVVGPFFGVGLFVWTSLIAVALIALALGYSIGGRLSDRYREPAYLYGVIVLAGFLVLLIPLIQAPVLKFSQGLGLRMGALFSTLVLFGPSLLLLGFVSPYVVKIAVQELHLIGKTVGRFYALSTIGSGLGTLLTGFFFIPWLGVTGIFFAASGTLLLIGCGYFALFQRRWWALGALLVPVLMAAPEVQREKVLPDGTRVSVVEEVDSYYGQLKVVDYSFGAKGIRELTIDGLVQGGIDPGTGQSVYDYPYLLHLLPRALQPEGRSALMIGVGAGIVPRLYSQQGVRTDVVDIDPEVMALAERYFAFSTSGDHYIEDARYFLTRTDHTYDYLLLDVFSGDTTPGHVLSAEAMALVKQRLAPGGVFAVNLVGDLAGELFIAASIIRTVATQFDQVLLYPTFEVSPENPIGNYVLLAYDGPPRVPSATVLADRRVHPLAEEGVRRWLGAPYRLPDSEGSIVLTDNYNPIDFYDQAAREQVRMNILRQTDADMLL